MIKFKISFIFAFLVILLHVLGLVGFNISQTVEFAKKLVPLYIILIFLLIIFNQIGRNRDFWKYISMVFVLGFVVSLLSVHTGVIFGQFTYGYTLGPKLAEVPVLIGLNWFIVLYAAGCTVKYLSIKNRIVRSAMGAFLVSLLDYLIEPVAIRLDYWSWDYYDVPAQNYLGWFVFSFVMLLLFNKMRFKKTNFLGPVIFVSQFIFFSALNFFIVR